MGDTLCVCLPEEKETRIKSDAFVPVIFEDDDIIICDKPAGMPCHRSGSHRLDTLENVFNRGVFRIVCRLDKDTSGLVVIAKHQLAASRLHERVDKEYIAVIEGNLDKKEGEIVLPIMREAAFEPKQVVDEDGLPSKTLYRVIWEKAGRTAVSCTLPTGRMHQIRVHFSAIGHPLIGDTMYGKPSHEIARHALHCAKIGFMHPMTGERCEFESSLSQDISALLR